MGVFVRGRPAATDTHARAGSQLRRASRAPGISGGEMFQVARIEDANVKILPENLGKPRLEAITQEIESLYMDKVIKDLGLVVTLYEIVSIEGGTVYPGEGSAHFHVVFRVVVFRPFIGEVLEGKLKRADRKGLYVSVGFRGCVCAGAPLAGALRLRRGGTAVGVDVPERAKNVHGPGRTDQGEGELRALPRPASVSGRA